MQSKKKRQKAFGCFRCGGECARAVHTMAGVALGLKRPNAYFCAMRGVRISYTHTTYRRWKISLRSGHSSVFIILSFSVFFVNNTNTTFTQISNQNSENLHENKQTKKQKFEIQLENGNNAIWRPCCWFGCIVVLLVAPEAGRSRRR